MSFLLLFYDVCNGSPDHASNCSPDIIEVSPQVLSQVSSHLLSIASLVILIYCWFQFHGAYFFPSVVTTVFITVYLVLCICKHRYFTTYWVPCSGNHILNHCHSHSYVLQKRHSLTLLITCCGSVLCTVPASFPESFPSVGRLLALYSNSVTNYISVMNCRSSNGLNSC